MSSPSLLCANSHSLVGIPHTLLSSTFIFNLVQSTHFTTNILFHYFVQSHQLIQFTNPPILQLTYFATYLFYPTYFINLFHQLPNLLTYLIYPTYFTNLPISSTYLFYPTYFINLPISSTYLFHQLTYFTNLHNLPNIFINLHNLPNIFINLHNLPNLFVNLPFAFSLSQIINLHVKKIGIIQ